MSVRQAHKATPKLPGGPSLTKASLGVGLETREIVEKFYRTGELDAWNRREKRYGEWSGPTELAECLNRVLEAQEAFDALPAEIRDHVNNDPVQFLELVHDPARVDELRGLGLVPAGEPVASPGAAPDQAEPASPLAGK